MIADLGRYLLATIALVCAAFVVDITLGDLIRQALERRRTRARWYRIGDDQ